MNYKFKSKIIKRWGSYEFFNFPLIHFKDPRDIFKIGLNLDEKDFPQHYIFANFQSSCFMDKKHAHSYVGCSFIWKRENENIQSSTMNQTKLNTKNIPKTRKPITANRLPLRKARSADI